jgi:hypothetical protein
VSFILIVLMQRMNIRLVRAVEQSIRGVRVSCPGLDGMVWNMSMGEAGDECESAGEK